PKFACSYTLNTVFKIKQALKICKRTISTIWGNCLSILFNIPKGPVALFTGLIVSTL
ncbi:45032_t:CDS:1, partial [Gigaspora margarita]